MIKKIKILGIIPARAGSKGIKNKNISLLGGLPLIAWSICAANNSRYIDDFVVTSDSQKIINISKKFNAKKIIKRPINLSDDKT